FKDARTRAALCEILDDKDLEIRRTTIESLSNFDDALDLIIPFLKDREWSVRKTAVDVMEKFPKVQIYRYLREVAETDEDQEVKKAAERVLGE
ncbi:MAG TPA: hypothetical protein DEP99_01290, partial [Nitrospiraceae bacterium]|nr:hypothetical protein [Nitrospiraceae bacterium]